jgi:hypothetical protein
MPPEAKQSKQEVLARAGLVLSVFVFAFGAVVALLSGTSVLVVSALGACAAFLLSAAVFAEKKVALFLGRIFPLG